MKILLPIDVTHPPTDLAEELSKVLPVKDASVHLLYVREELPGYENMLGSMADFPEDWSNQIQSKAKSALEGIKSTLAKICAGVSTEIVSGPPAMMIESVAADENLPLIAMIPGSRDRMAKFFLGSTSGKVVKHAAGTVVLLRPGKNKTGAFKHVIIGLDGSKQSKLALRRAVEQFKLAERNVDVTLINVVAVAPILKFISPVEYVGAVEDNLMMEGEAILAEGKKILMDAGIKKVSIVLKAGDAASEIIEAAKSIPADLVVIGGQGRGAVEHFLMGNVSSRIAEHAPCTVAVIKPMKGEKVDAK